MSPLRAALKRARPWLAMIAAEEDRPQTSDIHAVLRQVDAALLCDSGSDPKGEDSRSEAECEASQSGPAKTGHRPDTFTPPTQAA